MIGSLKGVIEYREDPYVIIDVNGVGYRVLLSAPVLSDIPHLGTEIKVFIYTHVREDALELFGFTSPEDLRLFEYLISVSGVGCKTAMNVFAVGKRSEIIRAISGNDVSFFTSVPRLGKKNAQKIIIELKNKIGEGEDLDLGTASINDEVVTALRGFGFSTKEAEAAVRHIKDPALTTQEKVRMALKNLGK